MARRQNETQAREPPHGRTTGAGRKWRRPPLAAAPGAQSITRALKSICAIALLAALAACSLLESDHINQIGVHAQQQQQQQQEQQVAPSSASTGGTTAAASPGEPAGPGTASQQQQATTQSSSSTAGRAAAWPSSSSTQAKRDLGAATSAAAATTTTTTTAAGSHWHQPERDPTATTTTTVKRLRTVCQVNDGESVAILEIEESRGSDMGQRTSPPELPISGSRDEIELKIESETHRYFRVEDKSLRLTRPLDRDATLKEVSCADKRARAAPGPKKVIIPVLVKVLDFNDNAPKFGQESYSVEVNELAPAGTIVLDQFAFAVDVDSAANGQVDYSLLSAAGGADALTAAAAPSSQRLQQRAPPAEGGGAGTVQPPAESTTSGSEPTSEMSPNGSSSDSDPGRSSSASTPPGGGGANYASSGQQPSSARPSAGPTINLDSEPIVNGPMEEPDEEESDEALLAAMNAASANGTAARDEQPGDAESRALRAGARRRRRKRRQAPGSAPLSSVRKQLALTTTGTSTTVVAQVPPFRVLDARPVARPPWTNLMMISNEDLHSVDATGAAPAEPPGRPTQAAGESRADLSRSEQQQQQPLSSLQRQRQLASEPAAQRAAAANSAEDFFALELSPLTLRPIIRLKRQLDYETQRVHHLTLVATDRAANKRERLSSRARITVRVLDGDDQPPAFLLDQVGCATSSLPRATTPLPAAETTTEWAGPRSAGRSALRRRWGSGPPAALSAQQVASDPRAAPTSADADTSASGGSSSSTNNLQLRSFMDSDQNFDFGDTLGLDDTPLDEDPGAGAGVTMVAATGAARTRRVPAARADAAIEAGAQHRRAPSSSGAPAGGGGGGGGPGVADYSCLGAWQATGAQASARPQQQQQAEYFASVVSGDSDYLLRVLPQAIRARDLDELNAPIRYSFTHDSRPANFSQYFEINPLDATIKQVAPVDRAQVGPEFTLFVRAQEQSYNKLASVAKLTIDVLPTDKSPPVLAPNSYSGFVYENAPLGTRVLVGQPRGGAAAVASASGAGSESDPGSGTGSGSGNETTPSLPYLRIAILDSDSSPGAGGPVGQAAPGKQPGVQQFEFETTSDAFKVDREGFVFVNKFPLDRDPQTADGPPNAVHMFQVTARQVGLASARSVSSPVSLNITLGDLNDNPPQLLNSSLAPVALAASSPLAGPGGAQPVARLQALDRDSPESAQMRFSIAHVSNGGAQRFRVDEDSGRVDALGRFASGEQFSLSVQVADELGRASQGILEVRVVPGANMGPPVFVAPEFAAGAAANSGAGVGVAVAAAAAALSLHSPVEVNEAVPVGSLVAQVRALDPENEPIAYSLIEGNTNGDFSINSRTGALSVAGKLDREEISAYRLVVQARDPGGLASSRPVHVRVTDANDQNPIFSQARYVFAADEATPPGQSLGRVLALDADEGDNGRVSYSLMAQAAGADGGERNEGEQRTATHAQQTNGNDTNQQQQQPAALFAIDERTGELRLTRALDYELARGHTLMVLARDHGESPRSSSALVQVKVLDRQDEPPYFERARLEARLDENAPAGTHVARVHARDPDSVAQVTYVLVAGDPANLFQVDAQTGLVSTAPDQGQSGGLDYESARTHSLIIGTNESLAALNAANGLEAALRQLNGDTVAAAAEAEAEAEATAAGEAEAQAPSAAAAARWPLVRVDVHLNDLNDNAPQFDNAGAPLLPVRVPDSLAPGSLLDVRLQARDADGSAPNNQVKYELVVASPPAASANEGAGGPAPSDPIQPAPGEQQVFTSDRCARLFLVDPDTCRVSVRQDLRAPEGGGAGGVSECQLVIRARDTPLSGSAGGPPTAAVPQRSLSSLVTLTIYIDHPAEMSRAPTPTFADSAYTLELAENAPAHALVKVLPVLAGLREGRARYGALPLACELVAGNELGHFAAALNELGDCELRTRDHLLDYEQRQRFQLTVRLHTLGAGAGVAHGNADASAHRAGSLARVQINLLDANDNRPVFASAPARYAHLTGAGRHLAAVARDAPPETQLVQLRASDADSPQANGLISYELAAEASANAGPGADASDAGPDGAPESRFRVDARDGIVRTSRPLDDVSRTRLPLRLRVLARDNPEPGQGEPLESSAELLVNLIDDHHRLVLVLRDTQPARVLEHRDQLLAVLQERTGLISGLERVETMRTQRLTNGSFIAPPEVAAAADGATGSGTDVWFHLVEPGSLRVVANDDPRLKASLFEARAQSSLADLLAQSLGPVAGPRPRVRLPHGLAGQAGGAGAAGSSLLFGAFRADSPDRLAPTLILAALFIALASAIVVIYQCGSVAGWTESAAAAEQQQHVGYLAPHPLLQPPPPPAPPGGNFGKEKFLFSQPPPPPPAPLALAGVPTSANSTTGPASQCTYQYATAGFEQAPAGSQASSQRFRQQQQQHAGDLYAVPRASFNRRRQQQQLAPNDSQAQEYETQMLKMSVLFDDNQSFAEHSAPADYADHKSLVAP